MKKLLRLSNISVLGLRIYAKRRIVAVAKTTINDLSKADCVASTSGDPTAVGIYSAARRASSRLSRTIGGTVSPQGELMMLYK